jgi:REP element-mobilizing transposase RayT
MFSSRRLVNHDYSAPGFYFVTACSDFKRCTFGSVEKGAVRLSKLGKIVEEAWMALTTHFSGICLHGHMVMPIHVHGIVQICPGGRAQQAAPLQRAASREVETRQAPALSTIVRAFKAEVTRRAGRELGWSREIWQHNYYDRVIRDGREFSNAIRYIAENPVRWQGQRDRMTADKKAKDRNHVPWN